MSRPQFAREIDVAESTVWRWEVQGRKPNAVMARHLEQALRRLERRKGEHGS